MSRQQTITNPLRPGRGVKPPVGTAARPGARGRTPLDFILVRSDGSSPRSAGADCCGERLNPNRPSEAPFARTLERVWEMEREIEEEAAGLAGLKERIRKLTGLLDSPVERMLLRRRYLYGQTWEEIASGMHYSLRWIYKLHGRALVSFAAVMERNPE